MYKRCEKTWQLDISTSFTYCDGKSNQQINYGQFDL